MKVKEFVKNHKKQIAIGVGVVAVVGVGAFGVTSILKSRATVKAAEEGTKDLLKGLINEAGFHGACAGADALNEVFPELGIIDKLNASEEAARRFGELACRFFFENPDIAKCMEML